MRYVSTRGNAPTLDFREATLAGLASDGGLYLPEAWPTLTSEAIAAMADLSYVDTAVRVMTPFVGDCLTPDDLAALCTSAYSGFDHAAVTPLVQLDHDQWLLELFHGPTLAFKDVALQLLGLLFERFLAGTDRQLTIIGATSGDTGSAAIDAVAGRTGIDIFMLHPAGRVSEVQRRQMTTVLAPNVHNIAIDGDFDTAQALVKAMFNDAGVAGRFQLSAVNSINWARLMAQVVYYFYAAVRLGAPQRRVAFSVPTGNFGDVFAGYVAARMGLPIERADRRDQRQRHPPPRAVGGRLLERRRPGDADAVDGYPGQQQFRTAAVRYRRAGRGRAVAPDAGVRIERRDAAHECAARRRRALVR